MSYLLEATNTRDVQGSSIHTSFFSLSSAVDTSVTPMKVLDSISTQTAIKGMRIQSSDILTGSTSFKLGIFRESANRDADPLEHRVLESVTEVDIPVPTAANVHEEVKLGAHWYLSLSTILGEDIVCGDSIEGGRGGFFLALTSNAKCSNATAVLFTVEIETVQLNQETQESTPAS